MSKPRAACLAKRFRSTSPPSARLACSAGCSAGRRRPHELEAGKPFAITILGERIVIWRTADGGLHALEDRCVHRLAPLSLGRCEGERLRCMYHGLLYEADGRVVEIPGQEVIPAKARV